VAADDLRKIISANDVKNRAASAYLGVNSSKIKESEIVDNIDITTPRWNGRFDDINLYSGPTG
jgi:hypothetical protein